MASPNPRWASPEDWQRHRAVITELYEAQNMTLADVMKVMEEKHSFFATARMYKTRFNKWGLQKTLRFQQVGELLRQNTDRAAAGKESVRLIRGKPVDDKRLRKYLRSLPPDRHSQLAELVHGQTATPGTAQSPASAVSCRTPSPGPSLSHLFPLRPPDQLRIPEETITSMRTYVRGSLDSGLWTLDPNNIVRAGPLFNFWNLGQTAKRLLGAGQTKQAFQVLQNCFHEYKALLLAQSPSLYLYTYIVALTFADGYPDLYTAFLRYITNLSSIVFSESHPLCAMFGNMLRMDPTAARESVIALTQAYIHLCQITPESIAMLDVEGFISIHFAEIGLHGRDVAETTLRRMMEKLEPHRHIDIMEAIWVDARDDLSAMLIKQDKYQEAALILRESLKSRVLPKYPLLQASANRNLFKIARDRGTQEEAVRAGHSMVKFASDLWGMSDNKTITLLTDFMVYLRKVEMDELADRIDKDFDAAMDELSKDIGVFDLGV
ncbi:putative Clr5 domain-containing protein [Seiridium cardinale]